MQCNAVVSKLLQVADVNDFEHILLSVLTVGRNAVACFI
jgi:hypothetical protein